MKKIALIDVNGRLQNITIVPERWKNGQSGFENASSYVIIDEENEKCVGTISVTDDKHFWEIDSDLSLDAENDILHYILDL